MILAKFYAVTVSDKSASIYCVEDAISPTATKIGLRGESKLKVGAQLTNQMISVGKWLEAFTPEGRGPMSTSFERDITKVNYAYRTGGMTTYVAALFLEEEQARSCFEHTDIEPSDPRWIKETAEVLAAIGDDHPHFSIPSGDMRLDLPQFAAAV
jgi:hypothetical protein